MNDADVIGFFTDFLDLRRMGDLAGQKAVFGCRLSDGTRCVLKLALLPVIVDEETESDSNEKVARMRREVEILASIDSPYVTRLVSSHPALELCEIAGQPCAYYLEHLIDGPSVAGLLAGGVPLPPGEVAKLGADTAAAISRFWSHGMVHRDVKPANIMRDDDAQVFVLLDAGYALDLAGPSLTRVLGIAGTLPYLSPERLDLGQKRRLDFRSDLYSLGVVMYEALAGHHPYVTRGMAQDEQLRAIAETAAIRPQNVFPGSEAIWAVVLRLLEKQPHARYRSCEIVTDELRSLQ